MTMIARCADRSRSVISHLLLANGPAHAAGASARRLPRRPDVFHEALNDVLEHRRVQLVMNLLPLAFGDDQVGIAQDGKVARNGGPARVEPRRDFPRRSRPLAEHAENVTAS